MSIKISELDSATSVESTDVLPIVQNGTTKKVEAGEILNYILSNIIVPKKIEYIESTGTQYIDTGLTISNGYHIKVEIEFTDLGTVQAITGAFNNDPKRYILRANADKTLVAQFGGYSGNNVITGPTLSNNVKYTIEAKGLNGSQELLVDGVSYGTRTISGQSFPTAPLYLLCIWSNSTADNFVKGKLYNAKYYNTSGTLIRDFVPALDNNNTLCLFDTVESKFYYNVGSGSFSYNGILSNTITRTLNLTRTLNTIDDGEIVETKFTNELTDNNVGEIEQVKEQVEDIKEAKEVEEATDTNNISGDTK